MLSTSCLLASPHGLSSLVGWRAADGASSSGCSHCVSELGRLNLPLTRSSCTLGRSFRTRSRFHALWSHFALSVKLSLLWFNYSMFCRIENFPLLLEDLDTNFLMLLKSLLIESSSTLAARIQSIILASHRVRVSIAVCFRAKIHIVSFSLLSSYNLLVDFVIIRCCLVGGSFGLNSWLGPRLGFGFGLSSHRGLGLLGRQFPPRGLLLGRLVGVFSTVRHARLPFLKSPHALLVRSSHGLLLVTILSCILLVLVLLRSVRISSHSLALPFRNSFLVVTRILSILVTLSLSCSLGSQIRNESLAIIIVGSSDCALGGTHLVFKLVFVASHCSGVLHVAVTTILWLSSIGISVTHGRRLVSLELKVLTG